MSTFPQNRPTPRDLQTRRIRWQAGVPGQLARTVARLAYGEGR